MADTLDINQTLSRLGLDPLESHLYATLLSSGVTSIMRLAKELDMPRTTVYRSCQKLVDHNFLEWVVTRQGKKIKAISPDRLNHLIKAQEEKLAQSKAALKDLQTFNLTRAVKIPQSEVRYYHGKEGMKQLIWNTLQTKGDMIGYSALYRSTIVGEKFEYQYFEERAKKPFLDTVIITQVTKPIQHDLTHNPLWFKYVRFNLLDKPDFKITGDTYIYNDIYAVNFWDSGEVVGIEIQNQELVNLQTAIFNQLLSLCQPLKANQYSPN